LLTYADATREATIAVFMVGVVLEMADCGGLSSWSTYVSSLEVCDLIDRGVWPSHWGVPLFFGLRYIKKILIL